MAHSVLHFSAGLAIGTTALAYGTIRARMRGEKVSAAIARLTVAAYALGVFGALPGAFDAMGLPEAFRAGWAANVFVFYPLMDRLENGGMVKGFALAACCFVAQYLLVVLMLRDRMKGGGSP